ncbi:MAG: helix-turn-helix transcriptional regulator [Lachnospiraceae bacterium]|nr:helix-turn-helix transcriptional regulator [Lachnospiraceae bacterium]
MAGSVASRITEQLFIKKMTQKELAHKAEITESAVSHYVKGDRIPRGVNLIKIANALDVTTDYLLDQNGESNKKSDFKVVKTLIARNAAHMTKEEKVELMSILIGDE